MANRLVVSSRLYQRVMVKSPAGMKPASQSPSNKRVARYGPRPFMNAWKVATRPLCVEKCVSWVQAMTWTGKLTMR